MSTYPHVRDNRSTPAISFCACGASAVSETSGPASWGDDCPRLMLEVLTETKADLAALRIEHAAWGTIIDATRADRNALRARVAELERAADDAILRHDEDIGRMQSVVYDALCRAVKSALPDEPLSRIDGAGSDGDEFDFTEAEVSIACGLLTDALDEARRENDASRAHVIALEQQNVTLLRWQSIAADAHVDHLCAIIRSLAVSDETPRVLRDLSAMGVEEEIRRAIAAERINREKSEATAVAERKRANNAEAAMMDAADAARKAERDRCAAIVAGWHIRKGGYTELAHTLRQDDDGAAGGS